MLLPPPSYATPVPVQHSDASAPRLCLPQQENVDTHVSLAIVYRALARQAMAERPRALAGQLQSALPAQLRTEPLRVTLAPQDGMSGLQRLLHADLRPAEPTELPADVPTFSAAGALTRWSFLHALRGVQFDDSAIRAWGTCMMTAGSTLAPPVAALKLVPLLLPRRPQKHCAQP